MKTTGTALTALALCIATGGCLVVHERDADRFAREHHDRHIVILEADPGPGRNCWRHDDHWHCRD